jgi:hypothetical protein
MAKNNKTPEFRGEKAVTSKENYLRDGKGFKNE